MQQVIPLLRRGASTGIAWLAVVYGVAALLYLSAPASYDPRFKPKYLQHLGEVLVHGGLGISTLVLGLLQFTLLTRWHRKLGYVYLVAVLVSGIAGLMMAWRAEGGAWAQSGFTLMALTWLGTAAMGLRGALKRDFNDHRAWMTRNYALTFGAVTLRMELQGLQFLGFDFDQIYPWLAWLCWIPNLVASEILNPKGCFKKKTEVL